ncbi:MAG: hypothetical protein RBS19_10855 [Bacteroidales bacterium]|nr:hypothetical protein [Bacteroidales bacterium]
MTKETINQRFKFSINFLIKEKIAKNKGEIALNLNCSAQKFSEILNNRMNVSIDMIANLIEKYQINPYYILTGTGEILQKTINKNNECTFCQEKEERIQELKETIAILKDHIALLNETKNEDAHDASVAAAG